VISPEAETVVECLKLEAEIDIVRIRQAVRCHGKDRGMGLIDQTRITTAASEILRNMFVYAGGGDVTISVVTCDGQPGLMVTCHDEGPGIPDIELAMQDGYSTSKSLGAGLPGARRLVDRLAIESAPGRGTTVQLLKLLPA
jgi:serine/threonine-protein kinase RsbT